MKRVLETIDKRIQNLEEDLKHAKLMREKAIEEVEKIRKLIDETNFDFLGTKIHITLTFGVSSSSYCEDAEHIIIDADKQLMKGKIQGKNRVVARNIQKGLSENDAIFDSFIDSSHKD